MKNQKVFLFFVFFSLLMPNSRALADEDPFSGFWRTVGYGEILEINPEGVTLYQENQGKVFETSVATLSRKGDRIFWQNLKPFQFTTEYIMSIAGNRLTISDAASSRTTDLERIPALPPKIERTEDYETNFKYFWHSFNDYFAFLEKDPVNWGKVYEDGLAVLPSVQNDDDFFALLSQSLDAFGNNGHLGLFGREERLYSPAWAHRGEFWENAELFIQNIQDYYLAGSFSGRVPEALFYKRLEGDIGYINSLSFENLVEGAELEGQKVFLREEIENISREFQGVKGIIFDIRFNRGGYDELALIMAGLFTAERRVALSKQPRIGGTGQYDEPKIYYFDATASIPFAEIPVYILTSRMTSSGAEIFVLATLPLANARRIGEATGGVLSDTRIRELPNGIMVLYYNEKYSAFDGKVYEDIGIPPDVFIAPAVGELKNQRDNILDQALEEMKREFRPE